MSTTIRVSRETKESLNDMGEKGMSYEEIIMSLFHQRNILMIHNFFNGKNLSLDTETLAVECFRECNIPLPKTFDDCGLNGVGITKFTYQNFKNCCEIATDEDLVGSCRNPSNAEVVTNVYCLCWDIPAPTWSMGRKNPFAKL